MVRKKLIYLNHEIKKGILYDQEPSVYQTTHLFFNGKYTILSKCVYTQFTLFMGDRGVCKWIGCVYRNVIAQCKKTTTVNKMYDRNIKPTSHSGTFACPNAQSTASQA